LGYRVLTAADGTEGLKAVEQHPEISLLLTDVIMPGKLNGPALAREAAKRLPGIRILYMSGYAENAFGPGGVHGTGSDLLAKPFSKGDLARKIRGILVIGTAWLGREPASRAGRSAMKNAVSIRLLVIDDDNLVRAALTDMLQTAGVEVVTASNGRLGLELLDTTPVDAVITDILMPEQEGLETIREARQRFPDIRILAISRGGAAGGGSPRLCVS